MAQKQAADNESNASSLGGQIAAAAGKVWDFVTGDKYVNAMARQGTNELGSALKAFPDSVSEYRYVHAADEPDSPSIGRAPWPSEIASQNRNQPDKGQGFDTGYDAGASM
jgi:hypothetical protein